MALIDLIQSRADRSIALPLLEEQLSGLKINDRSHRQNQTSARLIGSD